MTAHEADSIAELIDDCTHLPATLRAAAAPPGAEFRSASGWQVSESCVAQVRELDEYV